MSCALDRWTLRRRDHTNNIESSPSAVQNAIAPEIRGPGVPAGQTAVVMDVPKLGHVDLQHVLTAVALNARRIVGEGSLTAPAVRTWRPPLRNAILRL